MALTLKTATRYAVAALHLFAAGRAVAAEAGNRRAVERAIEAEVVDVLRDRIQQKYFLVSARVTEMPAKTEVATKDQFPFAPLALDKQLLQRTVAPRDEDVNFEAVAFSIVLTFDASLKEATTALFESTVRDRLAIDGQRRILSVKKAPLVDDSADPAVRRLAAEERFNNDRLKAESDRTRAQIELERVQLDLTKKELEHQRERSKLEEQIRQQDAAHQRSVAELASKAAGAAEKRELAKERSPLTLLKSFQPVSIGLFLVAGLIVSVILIGTAFKRGVAGLADGIKTTGETIGQAVTKGDEAKAKALAGKAKAKERDKGKGEAIPEHWKEGSSEYEVFVVKVIEKLEVLSRARNFGFVKRFVGMIDDPATIGLAASALLALPQEAASLLISDISPQHLAKVRAVIEAPGGLARAKATRGAALHELYGRIALDEFVDSPLGKLNDMGWLTRLDTAEILRIATGLEPRQRAAFLTCLSPSRVRMLLETTQDADVKAKLLEGLANLAAVDAKVLSEFVQSASKLQQGRDSGPKAVVDPADFIGEFLADLDGDNQKAVLASLESTPATVIKLREHFVPFSALIHVAAEWIVQLFDDLSNEQMAICLFGASPELRSHILAALPRIRGESITDELKVLDGRPQMSQRNLQLSLTLQRDVSKVLLTLVRDKLVVLPDENSSAPAASTPAA